MKRVWITGPVVAFCLACVGSATPDATAVDRPAEVRTSDRSVPVAVSRPRVRVEPAPGADVEAAPAPEAPVVDSVEAGSGDVPATEVLLDRKRLERDLEQVENVGEVIGLLPNLTLRGVDGFRVTRLPEDSPLAGIGLREGDVVHSVNGYALDSLESALAAGEALQDAERLEGEITRDGRRRRLVVHLD